MKKLYPGATIGIINPAFKNPSDVFEKYDYMVKFLEEAGYKVKFGKTYTAAEGYLAGSDDMFVLALDNMKDQATFIKPAQSATIDPVAPQA